MVSRNEQNPITVDEAMAAVRYDVPASDAKEVRFAVMSSIFDGSEPSVQKCRGDARKIVNCPR